MSLPLLASSTADTMSYYWFHQILASAAWGLAFFLVGLTFAALLWGGARRRAHALRTANQRLLAECQERERGRAPEAAVRPR
jgi:hypothetical protein